MHEDEVDNDSKYSFWEGFYWSGCIGALKKCRFYDAEGKEFIVRITGFNTTVKAGHYNYNINYLK